MILFYILLGYLLFRFITGFVIPVFRTTRNVREQFSQMNQNQGRQQPPNGPASAAPGNPAAGTSSQRHPDASKVGEYIDFEEVKP